MRKQTLILSMAMVFVIGITSCNKEEDKAVAPTTNNNTTNNPNPNPNPTPTNTWTWTGTAPFSVKEDGVAFPVDATSITVFEVMSTINITVTSTNGDDNITLSILSNVEAGKEYSIPSPCNLSYTNQVDPKQFSGKTGKYKIINISATEIEGYFYADMFEPIGGSRTIKLTEGYFKVSR